MAKRMTHHKKAGRRSPPKRTGGLKRRMPSDIKVWLDDWRPEPMGWVRCYRVDQVIRLLRQEIVTEMSLDHDLGEGLDAGVKVLDWLEEHVHFNPDFRIPRIHVHSANPYGRAIMIAIARRIRTSGRG